MGTIIRRLRPRVVELVENPGSPEKRVPATAQHHGSGGRQGNAENEEKGFAHPVGLHASFGYRKQEKTRDGGEEQAGKVEQYPGNSRGPPQRGVIAFQDQDRDRGDGPPEIEIQEKGRDRGHAGNETPLSPGVFISIRRD